MDSLISKHQTPGHKHHYKILSRDKIPFYNLERSNEKLLIDPKHKIDKLS